MISNGFLKNSSKKNSSRAFIAFFINLVFLGVILIQFPTNCVEVDEQAFSAANNTDKEAYFNQKAPQDIMDGFTNGFIVQMKPGIKFESLNISQPGNLKTVRQFKAINGVKLNLTLDQIRELVKDDAVIWVSPDRLIKPMWSFFTKTPDDGHLQETTGVDQLQNVEYYYGVPHYSGKTGQGVAIAIIDSGIGSSHKDFRDRIKAEVDFTDNDDDDDEDDEDDEDDDDDDDDDNDRYGHGTHVAGLAAGSGEESFDHYYDHSLAGIATEADLINLRVLDEQGAGRVSDVLSAIDWVLDHRQQYNIRVINMSLGLIPMSSYNVDPLAVACASAVQNGLVVVAAAGNYGDFDGEPIYGGITSPAYSPYVIAVGAVDSHDSVVRSDDEIAPFSSKGPTLYDGLPKPDLVAPGVALKAPAAYDSYLFEEYPQTHVDPCTEGSDQCSRYSSPDVDYLALSGTSMAAPVVSGAVALMLEANPSLTPNAVKAILMGTAQIMPDEPYIHQGAGMLNIVGAVRLASGIDDLSEIEIGDQWVVEELATTDEIGGEDVVWSQGVGWTGFTISGDSVVFTYQPVYALDVIWGQGVGWTGITFGIDPVFSAPLMAFWFDGMVDPLSLPGGGEDVLIEQSVDWDEDPEFINETHPAFPMEKQ